MQFDFGDLDDFQMNEEDLAELEGMFQDFDF